MEKVADSRSLNEKCQQEVTELHQFFMDWDLGSLENTEKGLERFTQVLADEFTIVFPGGQVIPRQEIIDYLRNIHGRHNGQNFSIEIKNYCGRSLDQHLHLVIYEEWHKVDEEERGRITTAIFREHIEAPNGVLWLHVHEVWMS